MHEPKLTAAFDPSGPATGEGIFGLPHTPDQAAVVLVPVPWEPTTSYRRGTAAGPAAIVRASWQVDLHDLDTGRPYEAGIAMLPEDDAIVAANAAAVVAAAEVMAACARGVPAPAEALARVDAGSRWLNERLAAAVRTWLGRGKLVGVVGGDHSVSFGPIAACAEHHGALGVLHLDAHADLRARYEGFSDSHASIMHKVMEELGGAGRVSRLVQVGVRDLCAEEHALIAGSAGRITTFFDRDLARAAFEGEPFAAVVGRIVAALPEVVYVSFDIDGLDPALCPHTGTPVPGGLSFQQATYLLGRVVASGRRIVGFDLVEVAPGPAGDEWDANVGARVLYKLAGFALASQRPARG
ncbi:MAG: agmatinase family protein [Myxococcales bacterium]|nr:agmatinase family protein [Myxococcales bacterium]